MQAALPNAGRYTYDVFGDDVVSIAATGFEPVTLAL
jgi:hypothetical protein